MMASVKSAPTLAQLRQIEASKHGYGQSYVVPDSLNVAFRQFSVERSRVLGWGSLAVGAVILILWAGLAWLLDLAVPAWFSVLAAAVLAPVMLLGAYALSRPMPSQLFQWAYGVVICVVTMGAIAIVSQADAGQFRVGMADGFWLMLAFIYYFSPLPNYLTYCLAASASVLLVTAWMWAELSPQAMLYNIVMMMSYHMVGIAGRITWERRLQHEFCMSKLQAYYATHDPLTQATTRTGLAHRFQRSVDLARSNKRPSFFVLVDVDNFKALNDQAGHSAGDIALCEIAEMFMQQCANPLDIVARLGGDEFVLMLHDTDRLVVERNMKRCQRRVRRELSEYVPLSLSIGIVEIGPRAELSNMLKLADQAMYTAKREGKARFVFHNSRLTEANIA